MSRTVKVAPIQMEASPAAREQRLERASRQIAEAAIGGAELVVLPELFNTGYEYADRNYAQAEPMNGATVHWMQMQAKRYHLYLAGTLLICEEGEIYNRALLIAPDGQMWQYDKNYPWAFERAYFRERQNITIAETELGRLGMMICWDAAHPDLWDAYSGKVDGLLIMSCPPKMSTPDLVFPDGRRVNFKECSPLMRNFDFPEEFFPGIDMDEHAGWLGVPVIATAAAGQVCLKPPRPTLTFATYLAARPDLWKYLPRSREIHLEAGFDKQTKVINPDGQVIARVTGEGDGFTLAEVEFKAAPRPTAAQPPMRTPQWVYWMSDPLSQRLFSSQYRRGVQQVSR